MRALLASLMLLTLIPQAHASEVRNYFTPQLGGHRIHACLSDGACGKAGADAFCKIEGYMTRPCCTSASRQTRPVSSIRRRSAPATAPPSDR